MMKKMIKMIADNLIVRMIRIQKRKSEEISVESKETAPKNAPKSKKSSFSGIDELDNAEIEDYTQGGSNNPKFGGAPLNPSKNVKVG